MKTFFAPGCALLIYKPHLAEKLRKILSSKFESLEMLHTCCRHVPQLASGSNVINICPGCDRRYRENYTDSTTVSLWEVLAQDPSFPFPDYANREMTIIDACPTRDQTRVHDAVRELIRRMNISLVEPENTRTKSTCCGDIFWGTLGTEEVMEQMRNKAREMPAEEVAVYCVSCVKAMFVGGRSPRYLVDLLFGEETVPQTVRPDLWHAELDAYINSHT